MYKRMLKKEITVLGGNYKLHINTHYASGSTETTRTHLAPNVVVVVAVPLAEATTRILLVVAARLNVPPVLGHDVVAVPVLVPQHEIASVQRLGASMHTELASSEWPKRRKPTSIAARACARSRDRG